jgi:sugar/nucleoside kinase (ribokinase family)
VLPLALVGNLSYDLVDSGRPQVGGAPFHCARALRLLDARATILARCATEDERVFRRAFARLGLPALFVSAAETTTFEFSYDGDRRSMQIVRVGDRWTEDDVRRVPRGAWVHVGALLRDDFPPQTVKALARGRRISLDGQGVTRVREVGALRLEGERNADVLRHVSILKLAVEEAEALAGGLEPRTLAELGPPEVIVTFGSDGSLLVANGQAAEIRAHHVDADPTGSGDAFAAAYLVGRAGGHAPVAAAQRATAVVGDLLRARVR